MKASNPQPMAGQPTAFAQVVNLPESYWVFNFTRGPAEWDCPRCGFPAGQDKNKPPMPMKNEPYKTHLAYVKERRTEAEANKVLDIALKKIRGED